MDFVCDYIYVEHEKIVWKLKFSALHAWTYEIKKWFLQINSKNPTPMHTLPPLVVAFATH